jgi:glycosyltransferase involved in cell wall biosynthesis
MGIEISAIVATRNRAVYLRKALQSLVTQSLDPGSYEILVVDNGSQDETKQTISEFAAAPNLRYFFEPVPGVSRARNLGWRAARGAFVAFLDDDAVASQDWLALYLQAFETFDMEIGSIGGRVELVWEALKPDWLSDEKLGILSVYRYSDRPVVLSAGQWLSICNLAYPRHVLQAASGLREDLGRKGNVLLTSAEYDLKRVLDERGLPSIYHPDIVVWHHISPARLAKSWFRRHAYWHGFSEALMALPALTSTLARSKLSIEKIGWALPRLLAGLATLDSAVRFKREYQVIQALGYLRGLWTQQAGDVK